MDSSGVDPLKEFVERHVENAVRRHKGIGGGFQVNKDEYNELS